MTNAVVENSQVMAVTAASSTNLAIRPMRFFPPCLRQGSWRSPRLSRPSDLDSAARCAAVGHGASDCGSAGGWPFDRLPAASDRPPHAQVKEGNSFYNKLFGANVKSYEIMAFKVVQAAFMGHGVHAGARKAWNGGLVARAGAPPARGRSRSGRASARLVPGGRRL